MKRGEESGRDAVPNEQHVGKKEERGKGKREGVTREGQRKGKKQ